jgi:protein-L-isoaspartate(D-aspartate) O-methyltransferase
LPIGENQTISQPFIVAYMTEALGVEAGDRVLEVGTGSGYQAAVLSEMGIEVYTVEIIAPLARQADRVLGALGYDSVVRRVGDGYAGWPEHGPYSGIIVTAAAPRVPEALIEQLAPGGRLVIPLEDDGTDAQWIWVLEKQAGGDVVRRRAIPVRFVPMTGAVQRRRD